MEVLTLFQTKIGFFQHMQTAIYSGFNFSCMLYKVESLIMEGKASATSVQPFIFLCTTTEDVNCYFKKPFWHKHR
eukprot:c13425_g1_i1 orf=492-716(+)